MASKAIGIVLALALMAVFPAQASAQAILDDILDRVNAAVNAANNARTQAEAARAAAEEMRNRMRSGVADLTADLQAMIEEAAAEARRTLAEENAGRDAFLPGGNCAATCTEFRNNLIELLTNMESLSDSVIEATRLTAEPDISTLIESLRVAPGPVLYPLSRVTRGLMASNLSPRLAGATVDVTTLSTLVVNGSSNLPTSCEALMARTQDVETSVRGVSVAAAIAKLVGKVLIVVGTTEFEGYAGEFGFVGGTIKANKPKKVGEFLSGVGDAWDPLESTCRHASLSIL